MQCDSDGAGGARRHRLTDGTPAAVHTPFKDPNKIKPD